MSDTQTSSLAGPKQLVVSIASPWGPLAGRRWCALPPTRIAIVNTGRAAASLSARIDPVSAADTGENREADLSVDAGPPRQTLPEGAAAPLLLTGRVTGRPGSYETVLRITPSEGADLTIPVRLDVSAGLGWGILLLLLGLLTLGLVNVLSGEGAIRHQLAEALTAEGSMDAAIAAHPLSPVQAEAAAEIERNFKTATDDLDADRPFSVIDGRLDEAKRPLEAAQQGAASLLRSLSTEEAGSADVDELAARWEAARTAIALLHTLIGTGPAGASAPDMHETKLAAALDRFLRLDQERLLLQPMAFVSNQTVSHLARARLDLVAGLSARAQAEAATASLWLKRATAQLAGSFEQYRLLLAAAGSMANQADAIRQDAAAPDLDAPARTAILAELDEAAVRLDAGVWPTGLVQANRAINAANLLLARARGLADNKAFEAAAAAAFKASDIDDIEQFAAGLVGAPTDPESKRAARLRFLALWQAHVATVADASTRAGLQHRLDAMGRFLQQGRIKDFAAAIVPLDDAWSGWRRDLIAQTEALWAAPVCARTLADAERLRASIEARLREAPALDPQGEQDRALNRLALDLRDAAPDPLATTPSCLPRANQAFKEAIDLSGALTATSLRNSGLSPATEARLMAEIGVPEAANLPRTLSLAVTTRPADRVAGRPIGFVLNGLDPAWGRGVGVQVAFGDQSDPLRTDAEALREGLPITHTYAAKSAPWVTATAVRGPPGAALPPIGRGTLQIRIVRSRADAVKTLAGLILNLRFGLALLIASVVYLWRDRSRNAVFARGFDYVEAFALGFAADAATSELPGLLAKLVSI